MNIQYDELMKQIIQAEYDFNNALANAFKPFVYMVDNKEKCTEQKRDESYLQGAEDMLEANRILTDLRKNGGMPCNDMACIFGSTNSSYIILHKSAEEILNGVDRWKKEKQEEVKFEIGDEIEIVDPTITSNGEKRIITKVGTNSIHLVDPTTFNVTWIEKEHAKKTGKHYDAIPFSKDEEKENQEEFKPGDEVEVIKDCHLNLGGKYVIMPKDCQPNTKPKIYSIMNLSNFNKTWAYAEYLKKTGRVYKSLTIYLRGDFRGEDK